MELLALLIGVRALKFVDNELKLRIDQKFVWCDAKAVLLWLNCKEIQPRFIENRLKEIRKHTDLIFKYVFTNENPAGICTRGSTPSELCLNYLWCNGPEWLIQEEEKWPKDLEIKIEPIDLNFGEIPITMSIKNVSINLLKIERFGKWSKLTNVIIIVLRFLKKKLVLILKNNKWKNKLSFLINDNHEQIAENILIKLAKNEKINEFEKWEIFEDGYGIKIKD